jgi:hypothetical protein
VFRGEEAEGKVEFGSTEVEKCRGEEAKEKVKFKSPEMEV